MRTSRLLRQAESRFKRRGRTDLYRDDFGQLALNLLNAGTCTQVTQFIFDDGRTRAAMDANTA